MRQHQDSKKYLSYYQSTLWPEYLGTNNEINNDISLLSSGQELAFNIQDRDDTVFLASLMISVSIKLDTIKYLETLKISGEGYFKKIEDNKNENNEYNISGFFLKASILL